MTQAPSDPAALTRRVLIVQLKSLGPFLPAIVYLVGLVAGVDAGRRDVAMLMGAPLFVLFCVVIPWVVVRRSIQQALASTAADAASPDARLVRLLQLPRLIELGFSRNIVLGVAIFEAAWVWRFGGSWLAVPHAALVIAALDALHGSAALLEVEELCLPLVLAEFHAHPDARPTGRGLLWTRQSWFLPLSVGTALLATLLTLGTVVVLKVNRALHAGVANAPGLGDVHDRLSGLATEIVLPVALLGGLVLASAMLTALKTARRNARASRSLLETILALAAGTPRPPEWLSTDELGDMALGLTGVLETLRALALGLRRSAGQLVKSADHLGLSAEDQNSTLARQASAIHQTHVTAQEIRQTSELAAERAGALLTLAERAEEVSRRGEASIQGTLESLNEIRRRVDEMAGQIRGLADHARQVVTITATVKDLADQSNMLALNAAIEAVRSGEHGRAFGIVAREMRALADQSIRATHQVRERLERIGEAIEQAVASTDRGTERLQSSFGQLQASGDSLRELGGIVRDHTASARQIAMAVSQQNAGVSQLFEAMRELSDMADATLKLVERSRDATTVVKSVAVDVNDAVRRHGVEEEAEPEPVAA